MKSELRIVTSRAVPTKPAARPPVAHAARRAGGALIALLCAIGGCVSHGQPRSPAEERIWRAARPILSLDPNAPWTDCYNALLESMPASVDFLMRQPELARPAAPDSLPTMLHVSLVRLLIEPTATPRASVNAFETTLDLLHFSPAVAGERIGSVCLPDPRVPLRWHDLYPADFSHAAAARIDVEADRRALADWFLTRRGLGLVRRNPLAPRAARLWPLLSRRYADLWQYEPRQRPEWVDRGPLLAQDAPGGAALLTIRSYDYNLTRAACIWLGARDDAETRGQLIDLVASPSPILGYNARFALRFSPDPRVRELVNEPLEHVWLPAPAPYAHSHASLPRRAALPTLAAGPQAHPVRAPAHLSEDDRTAPDARW